MGKLCSIFLGLLSLSFVKVNCNEVIVKTTLGDVKGFLSKTVNGLEMTNFLAIPFAKPPIGPLRFKRPEPVEPWSGVFNANKIGKICVQMDLLTKDVVGDEDCLILNIFVPSGDRKEGQSLPVMVFIHGGAFIYGSGSPDFYGPERFLDFGVILVTINYRLGPFGFLTTSNDDMPANLGLWDQNMALQWIQKHISAFGGDPNQVTIFGESAGAMSVSHHFLSSKSQPLFKRAIAQSGVSTSSFMHLDKNPVYYARTLAHECGCDPKSDTKELTECLRKVDAKTILKKAFFFSQLDNYLLCYKPVVDDFSSDPFFPKDAWDMIEDGNFGDKEIIIGNNQDEGLLTAINFHLNPELLKQLAKNWDAENGPLFLFSREVDEVDQKMIDTMEQVTALLFPDDRKPNDKNILHEFKDAMSDVIFNAIGTKTARKIATKGSATVYEYLYNHPGTIGLIDLIKLPSWKLGVKYLGQLLGFNILNSGYGVCHADELFIMFKTHKLPLETVFTDLDKATSHNVLKLWTDFAKTGNPTPDTNMWKPLSNTSNEKLIIGSGTLEMGLDEKTEKRLQVWESVWSSYPLMNRLSSSRTWKNPELFKNSDSGKNSEKKVEL